MFKLILICGVITGASVAHAGPAEIAAAMPNEASECRYLLDLCQRGAISAAADAARVIRSKHDKMPACIAECQWDGKQVLDVEKFK